MMNTIHVRCLKRFTYPVFGPSRRYRDFDEEFEMDAKDLPIHRDLLNQVAAISPPKKSASTKSKPAAAAKRGASKSPEKTISLTRPSDMTDTV